MLHSVAQSHPELLPETGLHELHAAAHADAVSLSGLALMLGQARAGRELLWIRPGEHARETGGICPAGLAELGCDPSRIILLRPRDTVSALQAGLEGARCAALGAVILELWGEAPGYDLTASRRLALASRAGGGRLLVTRVAGRPVPTASETRWRLRAMSSRAFPARAPGHPAFHLTLLRARNRQDGLEYHLEWDRDARQFIVRKRDDARTPLRAAAGPGASPLSGAVVPASADRPVPQPLPLLRQAG